MDFIDEAKAAATLPVPGPPMPDEVRKHFDSMPMPELAAIWCGLERVHLREMTESAWMARRYFDLLPHEAPERALDLAQAVLASEADISVVMQLNDRLMTALIYNHGARLIGRIETEARGNLRLCWLIGGVHWWGPDEAVKARLKAIADIAGWEADREAHDTPAHRIDYAALDVASLARAWVEQTAKLDKDRDDNWHALCSYEFELRDNQPDRALDLVLEILRIETHPMLLSVLSAGLLESVISEKTIDRVEREAAADQRFHNLLAGAWSTSKPETIQKRLNAILGRTQPT